MLRYFMVNYILIVLFFILQWMVQYKLKEDKINVNRRRDLFPELKKTSLFLSIKRKKIQINYLEYFEVTLEAY